MDVTESGIVTDAKLEHPWKADPPMDVTESGIVTDAKLEHPWKALESMDVHVVGISTCPLTGAIAHPALCRGSTISTSSITMCKYRPPLSLTLPKDLVGDDRDLNLTTSPTDASLQRACPHASRSEPLLDSNKCCTLGQAERS